MIETSRIAKVRSVSASLWIAPVTALACGPRPIWPGSCHEFEIPSGLKRAASRPHRACRWARRRCARAFGASARRSSAACFRWRAATRPAAGRWRDRWSPPRSFSTPSGFRAASTIPRSSPPPQREKLYERICATAEVGVAFGSRARIDRDNIRQASLWALARAVAALPVRPRLVFVDGCDRIDAGCDCEAVISGDALVLSIAAASIVAKVVRDRLMVQVGAAHPGYGFERHMGYSVPEHFRALAALGPTIHHRRGFAPVAAAFGDGDAARTPREDDLIDALERSHAPKSGTPGIELSKSWATVPDRPVASWTGARSCARSRMWSDRTARFPCCSDETLRCSRVGGLTCPGIWEPRYWEPNVAGQTAG